MLDVQPPPDIGTTVQNLAQQFTSIMSVVLSTVDTTVLAITRLAYISVLLIGLLLYFTHVEKRLGKDLIKGGVILAILSEFVFPAISKI
jgi:hypothetical protein